MGSSQRELLQAQLLLCSAGLQGPRYSLLHQPEEVWLRSKPWTQGELGVLAALLAESALWTHQTSSGLCTVAAKAC